MEAISTLEKLMVQEYQAKRIKQKQKGINQNKKAKKPTIYRQKAHYKQAKAHYLGKKPTTQAKSPLFRQKALYLGKKAHYSGKKPTRKLHPRTPFFLSSLSKWCTTAAPSLVLQ